MHTLFNTNTHTDLVKTFTSETELRFLGFLEIQKAVDLFREGALVLFLPLSWWATWRSVIRLRGAQPRVFT